MEELHIGKSYLHMQPSQIEEGAGPAAPAMRLELETHRRQAM